MLVRRSGNKRSTIGSVYWTMHDRPRVRARNFLVLLLGAGLLVAAMLTPSTALAWLFGVLAAAGFIGFFCLCLRDLRRWSAARRA